MASNYFGEVFRFTTFGESHGPCIGVVIDGCPAGIELSVHDINTQLSFRSPGKSPYTSPRLEEDQAEILSGLFEGKTTGAPIAILIRNQNADSSQYASFKDVYRPGHANFTYLEKYGIFDYRGGGRASARETAARVAAGAVAKKLLSFYHIDCISYIDEIAGIQIEDIDKSDISLLRSKTLNNSLFCPCEKTAPLMMDKIIQVKNDGDSVGGIVACIAKVPAGLGDPVYRKLEALLGFAMLSIPASKGFEIGMGFSSSRMLGSEHNDAFDIENEKVHTKSNFSGGTLGGISTGSPLFFRVAFKPTSSIKKELQTVNLNGGRTTFHIPQSGRHDPCVAIRAVPVVEAMTALVLADAMLMMTTSKMPNIFPSDIL